MRLATHRRCAAGTRDKSYPPPLTRLPWVPGVEVAVLVPRHGPFIRPSPCTPRSSAWLFAPGLRRRGLPSGPELVVLHAWCVVSSAPLHFRESPLTVTLTLAFGG